MSTSRWARLAPEERVERLTLLCALLAAAGVGAWRGPAWGFGLALGGLLSWLNFRWLKSGIYALSASIAGDGKRRGGSRYWLRLVLLAAALYAIFVVHLVAFIAVLFGLLAAAAAVMIEAFYEVAQAFRDPGDGPQRSESVSPPKAI